VGGILGAKTVSLWLTVFAPKISPYSKKFNLF